MPLTRRSAIHSVLVWAMWLFLGIAVLGSLVLTGDVRLMVVDGLGILSAWMAVAVCWLAVSRAGFRRWEFLLVSAAATSFAVGLTILGLLVATTRSAPFPSAADLAFLLFYPLMLAALAVAVRNHSRRLAFSVWLDCAVGSLGAASLLAILLGPALASAISGSPSWATAITVAYPMFDLLLMSAVAGIAALPDVRMGSRWGLVVAGLVAFASADVVYAQRLTQGDFVAGTALDLGWALGLALMALWVDSVARHEPVTAQRGSATGATALVVSTAATIAGLGVLLVGTQVKLSTLAVSLAGVTLLAAAARSQLSYRLLARMADLRREAATTDDLTGLPNRRALYAEGRARLSQPPLRRQALLMLDLDKFKEVNDTLGHHVGDVLLIQVATRLHQQRRGVDLLARLGGDEFALLLQDCGRDEATQMAVTLETTLAEAFTVEGFPLHISVSIGISLFPDHGPDLSSLLRKADIAMYKAKTSGGGHHLYRAVDDPSAPLPEPAA